MTAPKGKVQVIDFKAAEPNALAVRAELIVRDEDGALWTYDATYFVGDLDPYSPTQALSFTSWRDEVSKLCSSRYSGLLYELPLADYYREGMTPAEVLVKVSEAWLRKP